MDTKTPMRFSVLCMSGMLLFLPLRASCAEKNSISINIHESSVRFVSLKNGVLGCELLSGENQASGLIVPLLPQGMKCHDFRVADDVVFFKASIQENGEVFFGRRKLDTTKISIFRPDFGVSSDHIVVFDHNATYAYFCIAKDNGITEIISYSFANGESRGLIKLEGRALRCSISPDGTNLALLVARGIFTEKVDLLFINIDTQRLHTVDTSFKLIKGVQRQNGISWSPDGKKVLVAAPCFSNQTEYKLKGHFTVVDATDHSCRSFGLGYFGGWIDNETILVTRMPKYELAILGVDGRERKRFAGTNMGFVLNHGKSRALVVKVIGNAKDTPKKMLWDISGAFLGKLPDTFVMPWEIWKYK